MRIVFKVIFARTCGPKCQLVSCAAIKYVLETTNFQGITLPGFLITMPDGTRRGLNLVLGHAKKIGDIRKFFFL